MTAWWLGPAVILGGLAMFLALVVFLARKQGAASAEKTAGAADLTARKKQLAAAQAPPKTLSGLADDVEKGKF